MQFSLTNAGKDYLARVNAGEIVFHLTRAVTGSGNSSNLDILTAVVDEQQTIQIEEVSSEGEYTHIVCVLTNLEWETEYVLRQIGLYAVDETGQEFLVIIGQDTYGDRIPAISEKEVEYQYNIGMRVSNAAEVVFDFSVNDFLRKQYFYEHLDKYEEYKGTIQEQFEALPRVKVGPSSMLNRKDTLLFETLPDTNKVTKIRERDSEDQSHEYDFASTFVMASIREKLISGDTLGVLFGKMAKYLYDLKPGVFAEADNPFVLMTESTYKPPEERLKGSLYGFVTKQRGLIIFTINRYVNGAEDPTVLKTLYLNEDTAARTTTESAGTPYKAILYNLVWIESGQTVTRETLKLYGEVKTEKG